MKKVMMILGFLIAFIGLTTVFIVDETEQVVIPVSYTHLRAHETDS